MISNCSLIDDTDFHHWIMVLPAMLLSHNYMILGVIKASLDGGTQY